MPGTRTRSETPARLEVRNSISTSRSRASPRFRANWPICFFQVLTCFGFQQRAEHCQGGPQTPRGHTGAVNRFDVLAEADASQVFGKLLDLLSQAASGQEAITKIRTACHKSNLTA